MNDALRDRFYTKLEAETLIGRFVQAHFDFSGVPAGSRGRITGFYPGARGYCVDVEWAPGAGSGVPVRLVDGFSRWEVESYLLVEGVDAVGPALTESPQA